MSRLSLTTGNMLLFDSFCEKENTEGSSSPNFLLFCHSLRSFGCGSTNKNGDASAKGEFSLFENESKFHTVADDTLEDIQDAVEYALEERYDDENGDDEQFEVVYADGVLTMTFPPHGTWVLNKQTPNRQIWWSSPISGPRRYEYDHRSNQWIYTRAVTEASDKNHTNITLKKLLRDEFQQIYNIALDFK